MTSRAASIFDDREVLLLLEERPDLLAIADAVRATQAVPRRRVPLVRLGLLAAAVFVAAMVALLAPWQGGGGFTARALAALGDGQVIHVVSTWRLPQTLVDLSTGAEQPLTGRSEVWFDQARGLERTVLTLDGHVAYDGVQTPENSTTPATLDAPLAGFVNGYRGALSEGKAIRDGSGTVDGRKVDWLRFAKPPLEPPGAHEEPGGTAVEPAAERVAVDSETLKPILVQLIVGGKTVQETRIDSIETLDPSQVDFSPQRPIPSGSRTATIAGERSVTPAAAADALGGHLLWLGETSNGFSLRGTTLQRIEDGHGSDSQIPPTVSAGVRIAYEGDPGPVVVQESLRPELLYGWFGNAGLPVPGKGQMLVSRDPAGGGWLGLLAGDGLHVSIQAPEKSLLLGLARSLAPLR